WSHRRGLAAPGALATRSALPSCRSARRGKETGQRRLVAVPTCDSCSAASYLRVLELKGVSFRRVAQPRRKQVNRRGQTHDRVFEVLGARQGRQVFIQGPLELHDVASRADRLRHQLALLDHLLL